jgi:hypothetical protein
VSPRALLLAAPLLALGAAGCGVKALPRPPGAPVAATLAAPPRDATGATTAEPAR